MTDRVQSQRAATTGTRPAPGTRKPGEIYTNWPDKQLGVIDADKNPMDLLAVTFFSSDASYSDGDLVVQDGEIHRANGDVPAGPFDPSKWTPVGGADDEFLPLTGGTLTGPLYLATDPTQPSEAVTKRYVDALEGGGGGGGGGGSSISDVAPTNPQPGDLWWDSVGGQMYIWYQDPNGSQWVPVINAGVNPGTGTGTDGSYLPLTGGTLTGPLVLSGDPTANLGAATKQYVNASNQGYVNKFRNPSMDIWQRGATLVVPADATNYTADGWIVNPVGAQIAVQAGGSIGSTIYSMAISGAAGLTRVNLGQRIESFMVVPLAGKRVTVQFRVVNVTGATITPMLQTYYMTTRDDFTTPVIDLAGVNLQPISNNATTVIAYTFDVSPNAWNGYVVYLIFQGFGESAYVAVAEADIRVTPGLPVGLCANPPLPELRPIAAELDLCERYYCTSHTGFATFVNSGGAQIGEEYYSGYFYPTEMRAPPTVTLTNILASGFSATPTMEGVGYNMFMEKRATTAAGWVAYGSSCTASAEL